MASAAPPPYSERDPHPPSFQASLPSRPDPNPQSDAETPFVSGAAYFAMRPPQIRRPILPMSTLLELQPGSNLPSIPMPSTLQKSQRDVTTEDWEAFLNHLVPSRNERPPRRLQAEKTGTLAAAPVPASAPIVPKEVHLRRVSDEWNEGFFAPRNIRVVLQIPRSSSSSQPKPQKPPVSKELGPALLEAVKAGHLETASVLLYSGADPDYRSSGDTPMIVRAVKKENMEMLSLLLSYSPDINDKGPGDGSALHYAVKARKKDFVEILLAHGANVAKAKPSGGEPVLYKATKDGDYEIVQLLLEKGQDVNVDASPPGGSSSLFRAVKDGRQNIVQLLLSHGAVAECNEPGSASALHKAVKRGDLYTTTMLLEKGADVNSAPAGGVTAIYEAVKRNDRAIVDLLLQFGADINKKTCGGKSAITLASKNEDTDMVRKLLGKSPA